MKKITVLILCILFSFSFSLKKKTSICPVNYNGIYAFQLDNETSAILRFYADGSVLASTSINDYMDVFSWFQKENKDMVLKGTYKIKKCEIKFEVKGMTGEQTYKGTISDKKIEVKLTDYKSKKTVKRVYTFFAL
jgi:hypothetical protein